MRRTSGDGGRSEPGGDAGRGDRVRRTVAGSNRARRGRRAGLGRPAAPSEARAHRRQGRGGTGGEGARRRTRPGVAYRIGAVRHVDALGRETVGALENVSSLLGYASEGTSQTFAYPGAQYVKVHFDRMTLLPGDYVTVADAAGTETHRIESDPLTAVERAARQPRRTRPAGGRCRWTGDTAVVTLHRARPARSAASSGWPVSASRSTGSPAASRRPSAPRRRRSGPGRSPRATGREESVCGRDEAKDAVCYKSADPVAYKPLQGRRPAADQRHRAVHRLAARARRTG